MIPLKPYTIRLENGATLHDVGAAFGVGVEGLAEFVALNHSLLVVREGGVVGARKNARLSVPASWPDAGQLPGGIASPPGLGDLDPGDIAAFAAFAKATQKLYNGLAVGPSLLTARPADGTCYDNTGSGYCACPAGKFWINDLCAENLAPPGVAEAAFQFWSSHHSYPFSLNVEQDDLQPDVASADRLYREMSTTLQGRPELLHFVDFQAPLTEVPWTWMLQHANTISWKQIASAVAWTISQAKAKGTNVTQAILGASPKPLDWSAVDWHGLVPGQNVHWSSIWKFFDPDNANYAAIPWRQIPWGDIQNALLGATTTTQVQDVVKTALETRLGLPHPTTPFPGSSCQPPKSVVNGQCVCPPGSKPLASGGCDMADDGSCPAPKIMGTKGVCICPPGMTAIGGGGCFHSGVIYPDAGPCPAPKVKGPKGTCICPPGTTSIAGGGCFGGTIPHDDQPCNLPNRRIKGVCLTPAEAQQVDCPSPTVNDGKGNCVSGGGGGGGSAWPWLIGGGIALTSLALFFGTTHGVSRAKRR